MICTACKKTGLDASVMKACWCMIDLCPGCVEGHTGSCEWFKAMIEKPESNKNVRPLPKVKARKA